MCIHIATEKFEAEYNSGGDTFEEDAPGGWISFTEFKVEPTLRQDGIQYVGLSASLDKCHKPTEHERFFVRAGENLRQHEQASQDTKQQINSLVEAFFQIYAGKIQRQLAEVQRLSPLTPGVFFGQPAGLGNVFEETWSMETYSKACNGPAGFGAGFNVEVLTDKYRISFRYYTPTEKKNNDGQLGLLEVRRFPYIFIARIGKLFEVADIADTEGEKILAQEESLEKLRPLWGEFRQQFPLEKRIQEYKDVTAGQFSRAQDVLEWITGRGADRRFPYIQHQPGFD